MKKLYFFFALSYLLIGTSSFAQYTKLLDFTGLPSGSAPKGSLISDGTFLYGMTAGGGINDSGTIFKIMPDGTGYVSLLDFVGATNGSNPYGTLYFDGTYLYGMTSAGGANGAGTIFKLLPNGTGYLKLFDFAVASTGGNPEGSLISDGNFLYGMTTYGGTNGFGTIFKIMTDGTGYQKLLDFAGASNGSYPFGSLVSDGAFLYGMSTSGGINEFGVIFKIMTDGTGYIKLLDFEGTTNGRLPYGSLISDGTFMYGTTYLGGANNLGTIFRIMPDGTGFAKLLDFEDSTNGKWPYGSLISDGIYLYGMTQQGGINNIGTIFKITPTGNDYEKLMDFAVLNGSSPYGSLITDENALYGMTLNGGTNNLGTIFKYGLTLGIFESSMKADQLSVYPNPASDYFTISINLEIKSGEVEIYNASGQKVHSEVFNNPRLPISITTQNWVNGCYFISLTEGNKVIASQKLILID